MQIREAKWVKSLFNEYALFFISLCVLFWWLGTGASSKVVFHNEADDNHSVRIERIENVKDVRNYIQRIDEMIDRKKKFFEENNF